MLAADASPSDIMMMSMAMRMCAMEDRAPRDAQYDDKDTRGLRAFDNLHRIGERIAEGNSEDIVKFESEVKESLGVVPGQSWTLADFWKTIPWGRFKGLSRTYLEDVAVYEYLRRGQKKQALRQLIQNMKSKKQAAIDSGSWETAWHLTGLHDRMERPAFAGNHREMASIARYRKAMKDLRARTGGPSGPPKVSEDEAEAGEAAEERKAAAKRKAEAKEKAAAAAAAGNAAAAGGGTN